MIILAISDLHIEPKSNMGEIMDLTKGIVDTYKRYYKDRECIVLTLGDIINVGNVAGYENAKMVYDYLKNNLPNCQFVFVPGNHDLQTNGGFSGDFKGFDNFINGYISNPIKEFNQDNTFYYDINGLVLLLTNSVDKSNRENVLVDYTSIYGSCFDSVSKNKILSTHYGLESKSDKKEKYITSQDEMHKCFNKCKIRVFFHGHEHNRKIEDNNNMFSVPIIGVGPAFGRDGADYPQFNVVRIENNTCKIRENNLFINRDGEFVSDSDIESQENTESIKYTLPENYIERKVSLIYDDEIIKDVSLIDIIRENNRVVLLADAGTGKTYELKQLSHFLPDMYTSKLVCFIEAKNYYGQDIVDLLPDDYKTMDLDDIVFVIDGYDEIINEFASVFVRKINAFSKDNEGTKIIISSRSNFYQNKSELFPGTFENFVECSLQPFDEDVIGKYCDKLGVSEGFVDKAKENDIYDFLEIPFYLSCLVRYYIKHNSLPDKSNIMDYLVNFILCNDNYKYYDNPSKKTQLLNLVRKLAVIMQSKLKLIVNETDIEKWFSRDEIELLNYSGLLNINDGQISFIHNNFREYLAADFISKLDFDTVLKYISISDLSIIKPSWLNVVSYLVNYPDIQNALINWISTNQPDKLYLFESDKLLDTVKELSYRNVLNQAISNGVWIFHLIPSVERFSNLINTRQEINNLITNINDSKEYWKVVNSIVVISYKKELFDFEDQLKNILVDKICNSEHIMIKIEGLESLDRLGMLDSNILGIIATNSVNRTERFDSNLIYYFVKYNCAIENMADITKCLADRSSPWYECGSSFDLTFAKICETLFDIKSLCMIFDVFSENDVSIYKQKEVFRILINNSILEYNKEQSDILFNSIYNYLIKTVLKYDRDDVDIVKDFFVKTNNIRILYDLVVDNEVIKESHKYFILEKILDDFCLKDLSLKYQTGSIEDFGFFELIVRDMEDCNERDEYARIIFEKNGKDIKKERIDYSKLRKEGREKYFNALFDEVEYEKLLNEFVEIVGASTKVEQITDYRFRSFDLESPIRYDLEQIKWDIYHALDENKYVSDFQKIKKSEYYFMNKICKMLSEDKDHNLKLSVQQENQIHDYCFSLIDEINPNDEIEWSKTSASISGQVSLLLGLSKLFNYKFDDKYIGLFIRIPSYFYGEHEENIPKYLIDNYSEDIIRKEVFNLFDCDLKGEIATMVVNYCCDIDSNKALSLAEEILLDEDYLYSSRKIAFEYLIKYYYEDDLINKYLYDNDPDDELLLLFNNELPTNDLIVDVLVKKNDESETKNKYLISLIKRNNRYALQRYIEMCKENNRIPENFSDHRVPEITESLRGVNDIELLDLLLELIIVRYSDGFIDADAFGLSGSLNAALQNIAKVDYSKVKSALKDLMQTHNDNRELKTFCEYLIINQDKEVGIEYEKPLDDSMIDSLFS